MISLREHIDNHRDVLPSPEPSLLAFRQALRDMGECVQRAVPYVGAGLRPKLAQISEGLEGTVTPDALQEASENVRAELSGWADTAKKHHEENEREIKAILDAVGRAAEAVASRGEKHSEEIGDLTARMRSIASLHDLAAIRLSILDSTALLKSCVERMVEEGNASMRQLTAEVEDYRSRLEESERTATVDPLTQLANRRAFERKLEAKITGASDFSVILIDLNDFKRVNDQFGHLAGDDLLRQFAKELGTHLPASDTICRWGGDEFAVIAPGTQKDVLERVERINRWVLGEYKIASGDETVKTFVRAAVGAVHWNGRETGLQLLARADLGLYADKSSQRCADKSSQRSRSRISGV